jgi:hypothetical protein
VSRPSLRVAPPESEQRVHADIVQPLLDAEGAGKLLGVSAAQIDKLRLHAGLPCIDLAIGNPGRRPKGLFRYDPLALRSWWLSRQQTSTGPEMRMAAPQAASSLNSVETGRSVRSPRRRVNNTLVETNQCLPDRPHQS